MSFADIVLGSILAAVAGIAAGDWTVGLLVVGVYLIGYAQALP